MSFRQILDNIFMEQNTGVFDEFYYPYLEQTAIRLEKRLQQKYSFGLNVEEVMKEALLMVKQALISMGTKSLLVELQTYKKENKNNDAYKDFITFITTAKFKKYFNNKYPVLKRLMRKKCDTFCDLYQECLERLEQDKKVIEKKFGINITFFNGLKFDVGGDTHNQGKCVVQVCLNKKDFIFYKPHSLNMDVLFADVTTEIMKNKDFSQYEFHNVRTIDMGEYGWQEKVDYRECETEKDVENYYFIVGMCLAVFYLFGTEDIHAENIIVNKDSPVFIDLEILMGNKNRLNFNENVEYNMQRFMRDKYKSSVLGTYILPQNVKGNLFDIDLCALTSGKDIGKVSKKISYFKICDNFTTNIHYEQIYTQCSENLSIVRCAGEIVDAEKYIKFIVEGFEKSYCTLMKFKMPLLQIVQKVRGKIIRQITRATYVYSKFIDAAHHPSYLNSEDERSRLFNLLHGKTPINAMTTEIVEAEMAMMEWDDIPYFWTKYDSCDLCYYICGKEKIIKNVFKQSIEETINRKIESMSVEDMNMQIDLIYCSMANYGEYRINSLEVQDNFLYRKLQEYKVECDNYSAVLEAIYDSIFRKRQKFSNMESMFALELTEDENYFINALDPRMYNGLGVIYFITLFNYYKNESCIEEVILPLVRGIEEAYPLQQLNVNCSSAFNGIISRVYIYYLIRKMYFNKDIQTYFDLAIEYLLEKDFSVDDIDYVNGISGGLVALLNIYNDSSDMRIKYIIDNMREVLLKKLNVANRESMLAGMAHGYSGIVYTLVKLYEYSNDSALLDKAVELVKEEDKLYSSNFNNWKDLRSGNYNMVYWCHGAAGIALSRAATLEVVRGNLELEELWIKDIERGIDSIKENGLEISENHGICHGYTGNLLILKYISKELKDMQLKKYVEQKKNEFIESIMENGINYQNPLNVVDINFMIGLSGIGYALLKLDNDDIPNILLLDVE